MSLTELERRSLAAIAVSLHRSDPRLTRRLATGSFRPRTVDVVTAVVAVVLLSLLVLGITLRSGLMCAIAWTAAIALVVVRGIYADAEY